VRYVKPWNAAILVAAAAACGGAYLTIIGPDRLSEITNKIMEGLKASFIPKGMPGHGDIDLKAITSIGITLIAFYLGSAILSYAQGFIMATVTQRHLKNYVRIFRLKSINYHCVTLIVTLMVIRYRA
jgi:ATP-binding cassette subfamily B protein